MLGCFNEIITWAETWFKVWGDGPKKNFCRPPKFRNLGGRRGTHCLLELMLARVERCIWYHTMHVYLNLANCIEQAWLRPLRWFADLDLQPKGPFPSPLLALGLEFQPCLHNCIFC